MGFTYVCSDLHGEEVRLRLLLDLIHFTEDDTLYILGDVIDRTPGGIEILKLIIASPNMKMLLGNHESMMLDAYDPNGRKTDLLRWINRGGTCTFHEFQHHCGADEREGILTYLAGVPTYLEVTVNGQRFNLVHASPGFDREDHLWGRIDNNTIFPSGITICGHTPTTYYFKDRYDGPNRIFRAKDAPFIDIDCGCGYETDVMRRLGCLRLDDLKEFYV